MRVFKRGKNNEVLNSTLEEVIDFLDKTKIKKVFAIEIKDWKESLTVSLNHLN